MLEFIPSNSIHLKKHLETLTVFFPKQFAPVLDEPQPSDVNNLAGTKKKTAKRKTSPSKSPAKKEIQSQWFLSK